MTEKPAIYQFGIYKKNTGNGVNEYIYLLTNLLKEEFEINIINFDLAQSNNYELIQLEPHVKRHTFGKLKRKKLVFPDRFLKWLDHLPHPIIFHLHSVFDPANYVLSKLLTKRNIPYVFTPHDSYSKGSLRENYLQKRTYMFLMEKYVLNNAAMVLAITENGKKHISKFTKNKIRYIPNFVEEKPKMPPIYGQNTICFVGRLDIYQKGLDLTLAVLKKFLAVYKQPVELLIIGKSIRDSKDKLRVYARTLGLIEGIHFKLLGMQSEPNKNEILNTAYGYIQLSRFEGFGLSVLEAMAMAKPVIISNHIPICEYVQNYQAGYVVENEEQAVEALIQLFSLGDRDYQDMCQASRNCYLENFHPKVVKSQFIDLFREIQMVQ